MPEMPSRRRETVSALDAGHGDSVLRRQREECPCRRCVNARNQTYNPFAILGSLGTTEDKIEQLKRTFVGHIAGWGDTWLDAEWLENELDELLGLKHARWEREHASPLNVRRLRRTVG